MVWTALAIMTGLAWLPARKYPASGLPLACLLVSIGLAVVGRLTGAPPVLMICGSGIALAVWDLLLLDVALGSASLGSKPAAMRPAIFVRWRWRWGPDCWRCSWVVGCSFRFLFHTVFLVVLVVFGLDRAWGYVKKTA